MPLALGPEAAASGGAGVPQAEHTSERFSRVHDGQAHGATLGAAPHAEHCAAAASFSRVQDQHAHEASAAAATACSLLPPGRSCAATAAAASCAGRWCTPAAPPPSACRPSRSSSAPAPCAALAAASSGGVHSRSETALTKALCGRGTCGAWPGVSGIAAAISAGVRWRSTGAPMMASCAPWPAGRPHRQGHEHSPGLRALTLAFALAAGLLSGLPDAAAAGSASSAAATPVTATSTAAASAAAAAGSTPVANASTSVSSCSSAAEATACGHVLRHRHSHSPLQPTSGPHKCGGPTNVGWASVGSASSGTARRPPGRFHTGASSTAPQAGTASASDPTQALAWGRLPAASPAPSSWSVAAAVAAAALKH